MFTSRLLAAVVVMSAACCAQASAVIFDFIPSQTAVTFTLGDTVHTVHGGFSLERGRISFDPSTGEVNGEVVVNAASGHSGNGMRDRKMHKEILESGKYPDIIFRPDRVDGKVGLQGTSSVKVHGIFSLHGSDHEMTVPVQIETIANHWTASSHFVIPYSAWGIKNPSTFILRVSGSVEIDVHAGGVIPNPAANPEPATQK